MRPLLGLLALASTCAAPVAVWQLDGEAGQPASQLAAELTASLAGLAGIETDGVPPAYDADVPGPVIWDGSTFQPLDISNGSSLRYTNNGATAQQAPKGSVVTVDGSNPALRLPSFTIEAFCRIAAPLSHHMILASKRRVAHGGCSWSLSVSPTGSLQARFDIQEGDQGQNGVDWNLTASGGQVADGAWHHVAMTYDDARHEARLLIDYQAVARRGTPSGLVYDDEVFILGRGLHGLLDSFRLSDEALHPEQFLRTTRFFSDLKPRSATAGMMLDQTPTRVQTGLELDWPLLGTLKPGIAEGIGTSMWSLGCETLDRDLADWDAYRNYLQPLGIQDIRIQGGWGRTEREKGVYDWAWLDHIVDDALSLGLTICLETSYGNRLYQPNAGLGPGGPLPEGDECLAAWDRWVAAMGQRYSARGVHEWMMFNEPNLKAGNTMDKVVDLNVRTTAILKQIDPTAKVAGLVSAGASASYLQQFVDGVAALGKLDLFDSIVYHGYSANPDSIYPSVEAIQAMLAERAPNLELWQGEAGCASEEVQYALSGVPWTELSQAKWNARRMLGDLGHGVKSSVFTITDLSYNKDFISRYGLLKTAPDNSLIKVKLVYYLVQNLVAVFNDGLERGDDDRLTAEPGPLTCQSYRDRASGKDVLVFWDGSAVPNNAVATRPVTVSIRNANLPEPVWLDLLTGRVYQVPAEQVTVDGEVTTIRDVPVYDSPVVVCDRGQVAMVAARGKK